MAARFAPCVGPRAERLSLETQSGGILKLSGGNSEQLVCTTRFPNPNADHTLYVVHLIHVASSVRRGECSRSFSLAGSSAGRQCVCVESTQPASSDTRDSTERGTMAATCASPADVLAVPSAWRDARRPLRRSTPSGRSRFRSRRVRCAGPSTAFKNDKTEGAAGLCAFNRYGVGMAGGPRSERAS